MGGEILYVAGLGLVIASAAAIDAVRADIEAPWLEGQLVRLATGSPQVYYDIHVHVGGAPADAHLVATTRVGLRIAGSALVVRDGYDLHTPPGQWYDGGDGDVGEIRRAVPDGWYGLEIGYSWRRQPGADVALHLSLVPGGDVTHEPEYVLMLIPFSDALPAG